MKKLAIAILFVLALILLALTVLVSQANAQIEADDPGIPWGNYEIVKVYSDNLTYDLKYINPEGAAWSCDVVVTAKCVTGGPVEKKGTICKRTGNQKWQCDYQELRWQETLKQVCWAFLAKLHKCPPCPVCPSGALDCVSCAGVGQ